MNSIGGVGIAQGPDVGSDRDSVSNFYNP